MTSPFDDLPRVGGSNLPLPWRHRRYWPGFREHRYNLQILLAPSGTGANQGRGAAVRSIARAQPLDARNGGSGMAVPPTVQALEKARHFWDTILEHQELRCIYSGELMSPDYDLDHFLPWSFVTHDLIWNLVPAPRSINIQKAAAIPKLALYLPGFVDQHYRALPLVKEALNTGHGARQRALEAAIQEYATLFKMPIADLFQLASDRFAELLSTEIHAQTDLARRLSFETDWVWHRCSLES